MVPVPPVIPLDASLGVPLHRQLFHGLRDGILARRLPPGTRLPSSRALAAAHGVSRNTVAIAYDQLRAEGFVRGAERSGTFVAVALPDQPPARVRGPAVRPRTAPPPFAPRVEDLHRHGLQGWDSSRVVPFRAGVPALDLFPRRLWASLTAAAWRDSRLPLGYGDAEGLPALREAIAEYVTGARGARCETAQVLVTSGAQQALEVAARAVVEPGAQVWVEEPGYPGARAALRNAGAELVPVPVDDEGLQVDEGERRAPGARVVVVAPSHQYPSGATMSVSRRLALLEWARRRNAWVIEDDYDSEFRYGSRPLPCLQGLDADGRVIYIGTFSKTLFPALRLGYLVAPHGRTPAFAMLRAVNDRHSPTADQAVLARFLADGHYARHVRRMRKVYEERQAALVQAAAAWGGVLDVAPAAAGLHLLGWLPPGVSDVAAERAAVDAGLMVAALSRYAVARPARGALMLGYAAFTPAAIARAMERLGRLLAPLAASRRARVR